MIIAVTNDEFEHIVFIEDSKKAMARRTGIAQPIISRQCNGITKESRSRYKFIEVKEFDEDDLQV